MNFFHQLVRYRNARHGPEAILLHGREMRDTAPDSDTTQHRQLKNLRPTALRSASSKLGATPANFYYNFII
ncbi:MAG: hypothetical protein KGJ49_10650 [Alphaproteobacteria bacterium]|nr:hypothetical protein [Alphaproteobacteria bacterium]